MDEAVYLLLSVGVVLLCLKNEMVMDFLKKVLLNINYNGIALLSSVSDNFCKEQNRIHEYPCRKGDIAIVTGGARGIGLEVVKGLLKCEMHVIIAARNMDAAKRVCEELQTEKYAGSTSVIQLDLSSMKSVENFANEVKAQFPSVNVLVNNAGILLGDYKKTEDGFENQLATNYIGHFYLTHLLMENLKKSGQEGRCARVVNVSSCAHFGIHMYFDDFHMEKSYHPIAGYARSKMAQILSTRYLNKKFEDEGLKVRMYAAHLGVVATDMFYKEPSTQMFLWMGRFFKKPEEGAATIIYCSISSDMEKRGGAYMSNCKEGFSTPYSKNIENQKKLYNVTCELLNIHEFGCVENK